MKDMFITCGMLLLQKYENKFLFPKFVGPTFNSNLPMNRKRIGHCEFCTKLGNFR